MARNQTVVDVGQYVDGPACCRLDWDQREDVWRFGRAVAMHLRMAGMGSDACAIGFGNAWNESGNELAWLWM